MKSSNENKNRGKEYTVVVCDDDKDQATELGDLIKKSFDNFDVHICSDAKSLIEYIINNDIDAVLLDINLVDADGIKVGKYLKSIQPELKIIFVSGYMSYIHDIFEVEPAFFLLKPVTKDKLEKAFKFTFFKNESPKNALEISYNGKITLINYDEILYLESNKRLVIVHCVDNSTHRMYQKLGELENILPEQFQRCHQSYIVNLMHVRSYNIANFQLRSDDIIPISQGRRRQTKDNFFSYLKNK